MAGVGELVELTVWQIVQICIVAMAVAVRVATALGAYGRGTDSNAQPEQQRQGQLVNTSDNRIPLPLIYGTTRVGINRVFVGTSGDDNEYLHIIGNICEGEIEGFVQKGGVDQFFLNDRIYTDFSAYVHYELFTGTSAQTVCATLKAACPEWDDPKKYTAYIYIRLLFNGDIFLGLPAFTLEIKGAKIYNPVTDVTEYTNDPAIIAYDYLTRSSRRGGMGYAAARIDVDGISDCSAYTVAKGWTCDLCVRDDVSAIDNFQHILATFRGSLIYSDSLFKLRYSDLNYESSVMTITEDDVGEQGASTLKIVQPSIFDTPNAVRCRYMNVDKKYIPDDYVLADSDAIASDGDYREREVTLLGITSQANVMQMANYFLERYRLNKQTSFIMGSRGMALEPHDIVALTHSRPGWTAKLFRVGSVITSYEGGVALQLEEEFASFYDDDYSLTSRMWHDTTLPIPSDPVECVRSVSHSEEVYYYRGRSFTRWLINFEAPEASVYPYWDHADIYVKVEGGDWKYMTQSGGDYQIDPVQEGITYYCKMVSVSIWGTKQAFDDAQTVSKAIIGKTSAPSSVATLSILAHGDTVTIIGEEIADPDVIGYEVRLGAAWAGGLFIGFNETPNIRLVGVRPGTHTFWMAAKDNNGTYSGTPLSGTVIVYYPTGYTDKNTWAWDFDGIGSFTNTEHCSHSGDALKCSHTADVLTGTWLSPEYDLGSVKTVRVWGDFVTSLTSAGGAWSSLLPGTTLWSAKLTATTTWAAFLSPAYAGILRAKLLWGDSPGSLSNEVDFLEILGPEIHGRYVQVEVTLTDPDLASNLYLAELNMVAAYWS